MQQRLDGEKWNIIRTACHTSDDTDTPLTIEELKTTKHKGKVIAPGADSITYTISET